MESLKLSVARVELKDANEFIARLHRHHKPVPGHRFTVGVQRNGVLCGVCIVGRPVARAVDQRNIAEVTRLCTDGTKNACSFLYSAAARVARELGFESIQTYILESECGSSLFAAGWKFDTTTKGGDWNTPARGNRRTDQPQAKKRRFKKALNPASPSSWWTA